MRSVPPVTDVAPPYELAPVTTIVPPPALVNDPPPLKAPEYVVLAPLAPAVTLTGFVPSESEMFAEPPRAPRFAEPRPEAKVSPLAALTVTVEFWTAFELPIRSEPLVIEVGPI